MIEPTDKLYDGYYFFIKMEAAVMTSLSHKFNQWDIYISLFKRYPCWHATFKQRYLNIENVNGRYVYNNKSRKITFFLDLVC